MEVSDGCHEPQECDVADVTKKAQDSCCGSSILFKANPEGLLLLGGQDRCPSRVKNSSDVASS